MARRLVVALIGTLMIMGALSATEEREGRALSAWYEACKRSQYDCTGVEPPKVVYVEGADLAEALGLPREDGPRVGGVYDGSDTIFVNADYEGFNLSETLFHEMIHYLQKQVGGAAIPGPPESVCNNEDEAWTLAEDYVNDHGYDADYSYWWFPYYHCWPYFAGQGDAL